MAGGGVLTRKDLERMEDAGCDGALVASAVHAGRITAEDVAAEGTHAAMGIVDAGAKKTLQLTIEVPVEDMARLTTAPAL